MKLDISLLFILGSYSKSKDFQIGFFVSKIEDGSKI